MFIIIHHQTNFSVKMYCVCHCQRIALSVQHKIFIKIINKPFLESTFILFFYYFHYLFIVSHATHVPATSTYSYAHRNLKIVAFFSPFFPHERVGRRCQNYHHSIIRSVSENNKKVHFSFVLFVFALRSTPFLLLRRCYLIRF